MLCVGQIGVLGIESGEGEGAPEGGPLAEPGGVGRVVGREPVLVVVGGERGEGGIEGGQGDCGVEAGAERERVERAQVVVQERADQVQDVCAASAGCALSGAKGRYQAGPLTGTLWAETAIARPRCGRAGSQGLLCNRGRDGGLA